MSRKAESKKQAARTARIIGNQIKTHRLRNGLEIGQLASKAGVSRTTLYHLERFEITTPRASTLHRIAQALGIPVESLSLEVPLGLNHHANQPHFSVSETMRGRFDRTTNPVVTEVAHEQPELFDGWTGEEWDELYSTFGIGGALNRDGVIRAVGRMNRQRETVYRLKVLLETHLAEVAAKIVTTLYEMVIPNGKPDAE